ncbi:cytochrome P450 CYP82D47-like [Neltuma alba]|uniref:cytochrome P450 CYP82D47-like n=1 Tax=Neltuma alba TaxID=207710 RepID=UPI0010A4B9BC|nr:cytochrome P450 CYP82D47-like [Prosopis alba]
MEDSLPFSLTLIISLLVALVCIFIYYFRRWLTDDSRASSAPQASGALPIVGHLHLFGRDQLFHETLAAMADKYGPAFTIKMGSCKVLILSSWEMAKECFTVHDRVFSGRPIVTASKLLGYDCAMFGFAPYGPYWRELRKIATIELLSNHRLEKLKHMRTTEVEIAVKELYNLWSSKGCPENGVFVDMKQWFGNLCLNVLLRMVAGKRYFGANSEDGEAQYCQKVIRDLIHLFGDPVVSDAVPLLKWWDMNGVKKKMKKTAKALDQLIGGWLEEHKQRRLLGEQAREEQDFMDVMLRILQENPIPFFDSDTIIKATSLNMIAGADSIMVAITWALCLILNNPRVMKKAQDELDIQIGREILVKESDIKNLPYLQATVKECLRLYPASTLINFLEAIEDCTLSSGHHVPAGTQLMVNIWKIHRDEHVWPDPHSFKPERFLSSHKDIDVRGQNYEILPFGSGRRSCPGMSLALQMMHLTLATLLQSFEMSTPSKEPVDMTMSTGLTNVKATPLEVLLLPRLKF